jgi:hypothetical protein
MNKIVIRNLVLIWLAWVLIVIGFQALATARFQPQWPDRAQEWTFYFTGQGYQQGHIYVLDPFMNDQVAWDSEYYIGTAIGGYDDPHVAHWTKNWMPIPPVPANQSITGEHLSLSYAFFPLYSWMIWLFAWPLKVFGLNPIATATLAAVIVSALGALGAVLALYDLTREALGEEGAMRAVFYLLIFPTGFYLVQVYTEGLFVGLAFGCLAMLKRGYWVPAALLAVGATLTRAVGILLIIPMAIIWLRSVEWREISLKAIPWRTLGKAFLACTPLLAFLIWRISPLGKNFEFIETNFFQRRALNFAVAWPAWKEAFHFMFMGIPARTAYFLTEFFGIAIGLVTCLACLKYDRMLAWFSIAVFVISWASGPAQGIQRYILGAPAVFFMLAHWGKHPVFDRAWTILSILLMGLLAMLFAFNMWVA